MAEKIVMDILAADVGVIAIASTRISPVISSQGQVYPCVTASVASLEPSNSLTGDEGLDANRVRVDSWAETLAEAKALAAACRAALATAGYQLQTEDRNNYEPGVDPGLYLVTQEFFVWD